MILSLVWSAKIDVHHPLFHVFVYSTAPALKCTDLEMPCPPIFRRLEQVQEALKSGAVSEADIDAHALKVFELIKRVEPLGFVSSPEEEHEKSVEDAEIVRDIRRIGADGMVLLRNEGGILPLGPQDSNGPKKIAFIGVPAKEFIQAGGGSANLIPQYRIGPLDAFRKALEELGGEAKNVEVTSSEGAKINNAPPLPLPSQLAGPSGDKGKVRLEWYRGSTPGQGEPAFVTTVDKPMVSPLGAKPEGLDMPFCVRCSFDLKPSKGGTQTFGLQALDTVTMTLGVKAWKLQGVSDPFEYILNPASRWQSHEIELAGGTSYPGR